MNEWQEALDFFVKFACEEKCEDCDINNHCDFQANIDKHYKNFRQLVDRATPKKPLKAHVSYNIGYDDVATDDAYECPICGKRIADDYMDGNRFDYCMHCGQAIDWSEEE